MDQISETMVEWAMRLLKASSLSQCRWVEKVWLVEPGAICYVTKAPYSLVRVARTALVKNTMNHPVIYRVIPGWPCLEATHVFQGPVHKQEKKAA